MTDLACGTGRFLSFVKDNYPRLQVTALDLSQPYIEKARDDLRAWHTNLRSRPVRWTRWTDRGR